MYDLDRVGVLALAGGAQVAEADSLFDGKLAWDFHDAEPLGELVDRNQRHNGTRDDMYRAVGRGLLGVGPDDEEVGFGSHGSFVWSHTAVAVCRKRGWLLFNTGQTVGEKEDGKKRRQEEGEKERSAFIVDLSR